jgi:outer membrane protein assembly factor BamA
LWNNRVLFRGAAQASLRRYQKYDLQFSVPPVSSGTYFLELLAVHRDYPQTGYYGPGPDSAKIDRSNFRLEDTQWNGTVGVRPLPHLNLAATAGYLMVNVGPGTDKRYVSSEQIFTPTEAAGIDDQTDFFRGGFYAQFDYRDNPGGPRSGGHYFVEYNHYSDRTLGRYDFERLDIEVQQYVPLFNKRRVIALRGRSTLTFADDGQVVPFYLQPTVGGSDDLRGFRPFRFYDDNLIVVNGEYRWETFSGLDMALFADAGKVFPRRAQWNFKDIEGSVGFGLRFNVRNNVFLRTDVGFSHEGFQVWIKFNNIFSEAPAYAPHVPAF